MSILKTFPTTKSSLFVSEEEHMMKNVLLHVFEQSKWTVTNFYGVHVLQKHIYALHSFTLCIGSYISFDKFVVLVSANVGLWHLVSSSGCVLQSKSIGWTCGNYLDWKYFGNMKGSFKVFFAEDYTAITLTFLILWNLCLFLPCPYYNAVVRNIYKHAEPLKPLRYFPSFCGTLSWPNVTERKNGFHVSDDFRRTSETAPSHP